MLTHSKSPCGINGSSAFNSRDFRFISCMFSLRNSGSCVRICRHKMFSRSHHGPRKYRANHPSPFTGMSIVRPTFGRTWTSTLHEQVEWKIHQERGLYFTAVKCLPQNLEKSMLLVNILLNAKTLIDGASNRHGRVWARPQLIRRQDRRLEWSFYCAFALYWRQKCSREEVPWAHHCQTCGSMTEGRCAFGLHLGNDPCGRPLCFECGETDKNVCRTCSSTFFPTFCQVHTK